MKIKKPSEEEDNDFKIIIPSKCFIKIGDLEVATAKGSLKECQRIAQSCLKKKSVQTYLGFYNQKKLFSLPSYID